MTLDLCFNLYTLGFSGAVVVAIALLHRKESQVRAEEQKAYQELDQPEDP